VAFAEALRLEIESHSFSEVGNVTASFGISTFFQRHAHKAAFEVADRALYKAKQQGRNCVVSVV